MKKIYIIEALCNGCRLCQSMCSSLAQGVFSEHARIRVIKVPGEEKDVPVVNCDGRCLRPLTDDNVPTCVAVCPTGALIYATQAEAIAHRLEWERACQTYSLFKVIAPWKWPFPYNVPAAKTSEGQP